MIFNYPIINTIDENLYDRARRNKQENGQGALGLYTYGRNSGGKAEERAEGKKRMNHREVWDWNTGRQSERRVIECSFYDTSPLPKSAVEVA